jgi:enediyne biosynthesis protein E4
MRASPLLRRLAPASGLALALLLPLARAQQPTPAPRQPAQQPTQQPAQQPTQQPASSQPTQPTQQQRTGRSYDTAPPAARRPQTSAPRVASPVTFADVAAQLGVNFRHAASPTSRKYLLETMGAGVALFDYDADGRLDIFFTNGAQLSDPMPAGAQPDKSDPRYWNRLYRQKADGTFEDATERAGLRGAGYSMGAAAGDFDADGFTDLFVTAYGSAALYRNRGDGRFEDVSKRLGVEVAGWPTSAGWFDYDGDGRLDLFVARYLEWDFRAGDLYCGEPPHRAYCHPDNFRGASNLLFRQKPDGTFEDVTRRAGVHDTEGKALGVAFADFDSDGRVDVFVANDSVRQSLYRNRGDGTFEDIAVIAGAGYDENGKTFAGMGVDTADYDADGLVDVFVTTLSNETYALFRNNGDLTFTYSTQTSGVGQITLLYSGWGARFADFDSDGLRDIFVAQGHVLDTVEHTTSYLTYRQTPLLMLNTGRGRQGHAFADASHAAGPPFQRPLAARGAAFGDIDNDGDTDIVVAQTDGPALLLRNSGTKNHWLGISLAGTRSHPSGAGARVTVTDSAGRRQVFDASSAGSYLSSHDPRLLVGLGAADGVRAVEVRWPSGRRQTVESPAIDRYLAIREP